MGGIHITKTINELLTQHYADRMGQTPLEGKDEDESEEQKGSKGKAKAL